MDFYKIFFLTTGVITSLMVFQFLMPKRFLPILHKATIQEVSGLFFASHWGLMCFVLGSLIFYSAFNEVHRVPILLAAAIEKAGLIFLILNNRKQAFYKNLFFTAVFDGFCVIVYVFYIINNI